MKICLLKHYVAYQIIIISLIIHRNLATKTWAKWESGLTAVWLKWNPPVVAIKMRINFRVRRLMNREPLNLHVMIRQGIIWREKRKQYN